MAIVQKTFSTPYVLDRAKLSRLLGIIEQRFVPSFEVRLKSGKVLHLATLQHVLELDNSVKNPIRVLVVTAAGTVEADGASDNPSFSLRFDSDHRDNISLKVVSTNTKWANQFFAELEEQVDRTIQPRWPYAVKGIDGSLFMMIIPFLMIFVMGFVDLRREEFPTKNDVEVLRDLAIRANSADQKLEFLYEAKKREMASALHPQSAFRMPEVLETSHILVALPAIVILLSVVYMLLFLYPWAVFLWGDHEEHYGKVVSRRRTILFVVVIALLVEIVSNLFGLGLADLG